MGIGSKLRKQWQYMMETEPFLPAKTAATPITSTVYQATQTMRGKNRPPALMMHGIMPRCGTVYVGELLSRHPALLAYPYQLWEVPFLAQAKRVRQLQTGFLADYEDNVGKLGADDFLPLFGAMWIGYLYAHIPPNQHLFTKMAGVQYLDLFFQMFPDEQLLLLVRDGRDVVQSTLKSWPSLGFVNVCRRWQRSAGMVLACQKKFAGNPAYWMVKFEEVLANPIHFVQELCRHFRLPADDYPFDQIATIPVKGSSTLRPTADLSWAPVQKPQQFNPVGRWQSWSWWRKSLFKQIAGRSLIQLGYAQDLNW